MNTITLRQYFGKFFWSCVPLIWGMITYFLAWGPGSVIPIPYSVRLMLALILLSGHFFTTLQNKRQTIAATWFEHKLRLPSWLTLCGGSIAALILYRIFGPATWTDHSIMSSLVFGASSVACLEELLARTVFIKYSMRPLEFVGFNMLSSLCFTFMHAFYQPVAPSWQALLFEHGHFQFSLLLGFLAYKSQRIEVCMMTHMLSNLIRYTFAMLVAPSLAPILNMLFASFELILLGGIGFAYHHEKVSTAGDSFVPQA